MCYFFLLSRPLDFSVASVSLSSQFSLTSGTTLLNLVQWWSELSGVFFLRCSSAELRPAEISYRQTQVMFTFIVTHHHELCAGLKTAAP